MSRKSMALPARLALTLLLVASTAKAQPTERAPLSLGVGFGPSVGGGVHYSWLVALQSGRGVAVGRASVTDYGRRISSGLFSSTRDYTRDLSALVGASQPIAGRWQATGLVGVSMNQATLHEPGACIPTLLGCIPGDGTSERQRLRVGLPLEVGINGPVVGAFGIGVRAFANVNASQSYGGASLDLRFNPAREVR